MLNQLFIVLTLNELFVTVNFNHLKLDNAVMTTPKRYCILSLIFYMLMYYQTFAYKE